MRIPQKKSARRQFRLEPRQQAGLETLAAAHQTTVSVLIRAAIDLLLEQEQGAEAGLHLTSPD